MNIMLFAMIINRIPDIFLTKDSVKLNEKTNKFLEITLKKFCNKKI